MRTRLLSLLTLMLTASAPFADAQQLVGITQDNKVFTVANISMPGTASTPIAVTGITSGQAIAGADYRPLTGELYILGYNSTTTDAQLYTLNAATGVATAVNATPIQLALGSNSNVSFDFNPTVDRIRVSGANKKNYRLNPVTATIAATDGDLAYAIGDVNAAMTATIGASAYTNSYVGATLTTLYNYDQLLNILTTQSPPNSGTLNTVGSSGIVVNTLAPSIDMDIFMDEATLTNMAYLSANTGTSTNDILYSMNLSTGAVTTIGTIGGGMDVKNIAIPINRTLPALTGKLAFGIQTNTSTLLSFDTDNPKFIRTYMPVTGITAGQVIVGTDFRPSNFQLYALGYNVTTTEYQLYTINTSTAIATAVNTVAGMLNLGSTTNIAFDFNPVADLIRVVSSKTGANYRLDPTDGDISATDTMVAYVTGDVNAGANATIGAAAYTNSYVNATSTQLFALDDSLGAFVSITSPNGGKLSTVTTMAGTVNPVDRTTDIDFFYDSVSATNKGYISANILTTLNDRLYSVSATGTVTLIGDIGLGIPMSDIAVMPQYKNAPVGVQSIGKPNSFGMYPNPATNEVIIAVAGNITEVIVLDMTGKRVNNISLQGNKMNIEHLEKGIYFVRVSTDNETYPVVKLLKL